MTPRTFEGTSLAGKVGIVEYVAAYVTKMKQRNSDDFEDVAQVAGAPANVREPKVSLSLHIKPNEDLIFSVSSYHIKDVLTSTYLDMSYDAQIGDESKLGFNVQYMYQGSTGDNLLKGTSFSTDSAGLKVDWVQGPFSLSGILMKTDSGANYLTPLTATMTCRRNINN